MWGNAFAVRPGGGLCEPELGVQKQRGTHGPVLSVMATKSPERRPSGDELKGLPPVMQHIQAVTELQARANEA